MRFTAFELFNRFKGTFKRDVTDRLSEHGLSGLIDL